MFCFLLVLTVWPKQLFLCTGSGRVTFNNQRSYLKAVCAAFVEIKTPKFTKKVRKNLSLVFVLCIISVSAVVESDCLCWTD